MTETPEKIARELIIAGHSLCAEHCQTLNIDCKCFREITQAIQAARDEALEKALKAVAIVKDVWAADKTVSHYLVIGEIVTEITALKSKEPSDDRNT